MNPSTKKRLKKKNPSIFELGKELFFSGQTLTDQKNFAEFGLRKIPKLDHKFTKFKFNENIDEANIKCKLKNEILNISIGDGNPIPVGNGRVVEEVFLSHFLNKYKHLRFFWVESIEGRMIENKIAVIDDNWAVVGLLNTRPEIKED